MDGDSHLPKPALRSFAADGELRYLLRFVPLQSFNGFSLSLLRSAHLHHQDDLCRILRFNDSHHTADAHAEPWVSIYFLMRASHAYNHFFPFFPFARCGLRLVCFPTIPSNPNLTTHLQFSFHSPLIITLSPFPSPLSNSATMGFTFPFTRTRKTSTPIKKTRTSLHHLRFFPETKVSTRLLDVRTYSAYHTLGEVCTIYSVRCGLYHRYINHYVPPFQRQRTDLHTRDFSSGYLTSPVCIHYSEKD